MISRVGFRKPAFAISLADQNRLKNLPRQIFSSYVKFGGNPCRDVDTLGFYTHTHTHRYTNTHTHTRMKLYIRLAVVPVLCTGCPTFLINFEPAFWKKAFSVSLRLFLYFLPDFTVLHFPHSLRFQRRLPRLEISYWI